MPGPGGGGHGGGGHGGGGFGGGRGGGGFGGGPRGGGFGGGPRGGGFGGGPHGPHGFGGGPRPPRGPHWGGGWWGRGPRRYGGGGCLGFLLAPIILIMVVVIIFSSVFSSAFLSLSGKGGIAYDENTFGDYADEQYMAEFGSSTAYEDNLLIVFLTNEECDEYYYMAWLGDHLEAPIYNMFGDNYSEFGRVVNAAINSASYKYSLDTNLASVINQTEAKITSLGLESSFTCSENHVQVTSHITNKTALPITESTVNAALEKFTENTGIPVVIVVEDMEEVFPTYVSVGSIIFLIIIVVLIAVVIYFIVRNVRKRKEDEYYNN